MFTVGSMVTTSASIVPPTSFTTYKTKKPSRVPTPASQSHIGPTHVVGVVREAGFL